MSNYQTGDLLLANQWTVTSILNHAFDAGSQWSDVGIFIVDRPGISERSNNGYLDPSKVSNGKIDKTDDGVRIMMMTPTGVKVLTVDELLRTPSLQAAAHRPLAVKDRKDVQRNMASYIMNVVRTTAADPKRIVSNPFPPGLKQILSGENAEDVVKSSHGTLIDENGRDVKVSGFVKGNPNSQLKADVTAADLIGSILAQAQLIQYDPQISISDFQQGGRLDDIYGDEVQLFPRKPAEDVRQYLLHKARQEAELLVLQYFETAPVANFDRYRSRVIFPPPRAEGYIDESGGTDEDFGTDYPDQNLAAYSTAAAKERRGNTNAIALGVESDTIDRKIRQQVEEAEKYARPTPSYGGKKK